MTAHIERFSGLLYVAIYQQILEAGDKGGRTIEQGQPGVTKHDVPRSSREKCDLFLGRYLVVGTPGFLPYHTQSPLLLEDSSAVHQFLQAIMSFLASCLPCCCVNQEEEEDTSRESSKESSRAIVQFRGVRGTLEIVVQSIIAHFGEGP